ncbi:hypothetical protein LSAT2_001033 [Lamellibrachia satsuma]|nr:hypothetical protein LSAT2_001033 [Lamellibrachia satsuma]
MHQDEGTRGGVGRAEAARCGNGGKGTGGCASSSGGGTVDDKVGKDTRDARESSLQPGRKLRGGKVTGHRETGRKETGRIGTGGKTTGVKERGVGETGGKEKGVGELGGKTTGVKERGVAETGGKEKGVGEIGGKTTGVKERGVGETGGKEKGVGETEGKTTGVEERGVGETRAKEWEVGETGGKGSGQNVMEGIERKSYSAAVIEGVRKRARVFVGDSIVRKTDRVLNKGDDVVVCLPGAKIEEITERVKNIVGSDPANDVKAQRRLEPRDDDQFKVPTVPVEWMTWLQHRRKEPPTTEEREQNYVKMIITQQRAKELEDKRRVEDPEPDKEVDISQLNKKMSFPRYADYDEIVKKAEEGTDCPSDDTDSKK